MKDLSRVIAKGSCTVLRGERNSNVSDLPDDIEEYPELHGYRQSATDAEYVILPKDEQEKPQQTPDPASTHATGQKDGKGNPLTADLNPPVITLEQIKELQKLIKETDSNEVSFLQYLQVETLAHIPADRFTWAKKALEAKKKATEKDNSNLVIAALASRNIPFQVDEQAGEIHATPSFQDTGAKAFLKEQGFKWNPAEKAWIKQAA